MENDIILSSPMMTDSAIDKSVAEDTNWLLLNENGCGWMLRGEAGMYS